MRGRDKRRAYTDTRLYLAREIRTSDGGSHALSRGDFTCKKGRRRSSDGYLTFARELDRDTRALFAKKRGHRGVRSRLRRLFGLFASFGRALVSRACEKPGVANCVSRLESGLNGAFSQILFVKDGTRPRLTQRLEPQRARRYRRYRRVANPICRARAE